MSSERIDIDLEALESFISALQSFNSDLTSRWGTLKGRWQASSESWRDRKKDQFEGEVGWDEVIRMMEGYLSTSEEHVNYLKRLYARGSEYKDT
jgi:hypothetical protein